MPENINTRSYWEKRFSSGDWEEKKGRWQTESFARGQVAHLPLEDDFEGTILDFGCGLGDAMPIYKQHFPNAKLVGMDFSQSAIDKCWEKYGSIASFIQGDHNSVNYYDVILASNVFEHLTDDRLIAKSLIAKCKSLFIIVPYKERPLSAEHINMYDEHYYSGVGKYDFKVFPCPGWTATGIKDLWYQIYFKNIFRYLLGRPCCHRNMQIIFHFSGLVQDTHIVS